MQPEAEVLRNRIWTVALVGMTLGMVGLLVVLRPTLGRGARLSLTGFDTGLGLMAIGSFVEYWILFRLPHEGGPGAAARGLAWMTFLVGVLLLLVFSVSTGIALLRTSRVPPWVGVLFLLLVPATALLGYVHRVGAALPIACLSSAALVLDLRDRPQAEGQQQDAATS